MFKLIKFVVLLNYLLICMTRLHYIFCAEVDLQNELIQLTLTQKIKVNEMLEKLKPRYELSTYLIDPINRNTCYLFIENTCLKEIKHFTIFLNDDCSFEETKSKILNNYDIINNTFEKCFDSKIKIQVEIDNFKPILILFDVIRFNNILKLIFNNLVVMMHNIDKNIQVQINFDHTIKNGKKKTILNILNNLYKVLEEAYRMQNFNILYLQSETNILQYFQNIEKFLTSKIIFKQNYQMLSLTMKINEINKLSACLYFFCKQRKISIYQLIRHGLEEINQHENKLIKNTYIICFVKILTDTTKFKTKSSLLKLVVFIFLHYKRKITDINNVESLTLLYNITRICKKENVTNFARSEMCLFYETEIIDMKKILILRYIYFNFTHKIIDNAIILKIYTYVQYFELLWLIIKCCIKATYTILKINI